MSIRLTSPVLLDLRALTRIQDVAGATNGRHEVGGILLGSYRGRSVHVTASTEPQPEDRFSFTRFFRSKIGHQSLAHSAWRASRGRTTYVGEWHSHPESYPMPSSIDWRDWRRKVAEQRMRLVFVIVGYDGVYVAASNEAGAIARLIEIERDNNGVLYG